MSTRALVIAAFAGYLGLLVVVGLTAARRMRSFRDYVTGGGAIPAWALALSFMANFISSNSFVGHSSKSYEVGPIWFVVGATMVACCALSWNWFAPRFAEFARERGTTTLPEFFHQRFASAAVGQLAHWMVVAATLVYLLAVMRGIALVVENGLEVSYVQALLIVYGVTLAYAFLGGLWADVSTDVVQSVVLVAGAIALFFGVLLAEPVESFTAAPPVKTIPLGLVLAVAAGGGVKLLADPKQVMVFYAFRDAASVRRLRWLGPAILLTVYTCLFPLGWMARKIVPHPGQLEELIPKLVFEHQLLGGWFGAVFLVSLLAASMSSLDSALLVVASCVEKHVVSPLTKTEASAWRARGLLVTVATGVLLLSLRPLGGIIELTTFSGALVGSALLPAIVVGLRSRDAIPSAVIAASIVAGSVACVAGKFLPQALDTGSPWLRDIFVGLTASTLVLTAYRLRTRRVPTPDPTA